MPEDRPSYTEQHQDSGRGRPRTSWLDNEKNVDRSDIGEGKRRYKQKQQVMATTAEDSFICSQPSDRGWLKEEES